MYIIYNADGSINKQYLNEFIQEGNSYANVLFVAIIGREPADYYLNAFAKLPNNVNIELPTEDSSLILDGITYVGKNVSITSDATTRPGSLQLNIVAENLPGTERLVSFNLYLTVNETGLAVDDPAVMTIAQYQSLLNRINEIDKFEKIELTGTSGTLTETQIGYITGSVGTYIKNGDEIFWQNKVSDSQAEFINTSHAYKKVITINLTDRTWSLFNYQWFDITVSSSHTSGTLTAEQLASLNENLAVRITRGNWVFDTSEKSTTNFIFRSWGENELRTINVNRTSGAWALSSIQYQDITTPTAQAVTYDNTNSGLVGTNVQDAIDEVADTVNNDILTVKDIRTLTGKRTATEFEVLTNYNFYFSIQNTGFTATSGYGLKIKREAGKRYLLLIKTNIVSPNVLGGLWDNASSPGDGRYQAEPLGNQWYGCIVTSATTVEEAPIIFQLLSATVEGTPTVYAACVIDLDSQNILTGTTVETIITELTNEQWVELCSNAYLLISKKIEANKISLDSGETVQEAIDEINDDLIYALIHNRMGLVELVSNALQDGYINNSGNIVDYTNAVVSDFIEVIPNTIVKYNLLGISGISAFLVLYDSNYEIHEILLSSNGAQGTWGVNEGEITIPDKVKYIKYCAQKFLDEQSYSQYLEYTSGTQTVKQQVQYLSQTQENQWLNKKWFAFGTSITATNYVLNDETGEVSGKYVPYLAELSGMQVNNYGIAGGTIASNGPHGGSSAILNRILSTDVSEADLITIEGFVNDFACGIPLGDETSTTNKTLFGALRLAVEYCQQNSNATVVLITESTGQNIESLGANYSIDKVNDAYKSETDTTLIHLYQNDYNKTIKKVAEFVGCICIDAGSKSGINYLHPQYLSDWIHQSELGGEQYAQTIWSELKNIYPMK